MKKITLTLIAIIAIITFSFGQTEEATTKSGKKVILNPDGTWKYAEEKKKVTTTDPSDCSNYIETTEDKMTGRKTTAAKSSIVVSTDGGKKGLGILLMLSEKGTIIMSISAVGAGHCIDEGDKINILFADGSKLELASDGKFNCQGDATVYFGGVFGKKKQLEELKSKKIQTMRVWTSDGFVEKDFTSDNSQEFFQTINCLLNQ